MKNKNLLLSLIVLNALSTLLLEEISKYERFRENFNTGKLNNDDSYKIIENMF